MSRVGDHVVVHHGYWDASDPWVLSGRDPMLAPSARIWGYNTNFGSFAQFCRAQAHQVLPEGTAAVVGRGGSPDAGRHDGLPDDARLGRQHRPGDDLVLVWGGSGGLGSQAMQLAAAAKALPIAVVSDESRGAYVEKLGAVGWINRQEYRPLGTAAAHRRRRPASGSG